MPSRLGGWADEELQQAFLDGEHRFWTLVDDTDAQGCWGWIGPHRGQYGTFPFANMFLPAHKAMLLYLGVDVPGPLVVDHLCEIKRCVSPNHLEVVTQSINVIRGRRRLPHERRVATIPAARLEGWQQRRRQRELRALRNAEGWRSPVLIDGAWEPRYG